MKSVTDPVDKMRSDWKLIHIITAMCCLYVVIIRCSSERKLYISLERPTVVYSNPKYVTNLVVKAKRLSRNDPVHYLTINLTLLDNFDNRSRVDFAFYELLSNMYKRTFVEWHNSGCDLLEDELLGSSLKAVYAKNNNNGIPFKCPMPPGNYSFPNMFISLSALLGSFPFQQGRAYVNVSTLGELSFYGHIDFQIKSYRADRYGGTKN